MASRPRTARMFVLDSDGQWPQIGTRCYCFGLPAAKQTHKVSWSGTCTVPQSPTLFKQGALWGAAFTPDSKLVAAGSNGGCVFVWDTASGKVKCSLGAAAQVFSAIDVDSTGKYLAAGGDDGKVYLWQLSKRKLLRSFRATDADFFRAVAFSPDGKCVATCGRDSFVAVWNIPSGEKKMELHGPSHQNPFERIQDLAFSRDGRILAAAHPDHCIRIWNLKEGKADAIQCPFKICRLAFHPDGRTLAIAGDGDNLVRLWDTVAGQAISDLETGADWNSVNFVAFNHNGTSLVTNGKGGSLLLLDVIRRP